jgi:hypothetical protein
LPISQGRQGEDAADSAIKDTPTHNAESVMFAFAFQTTGTVFGTFATNESLHDQCHEKKKRGEKREFYLVQYFLYF